MRSRPRKTVWTGEAQGCEGKSQSDVAGHSCPSRRDQKRRPISTCGPIKAPVIPRAHNFPSPAMANGHPHPHFHPHHLPPTHSHPPTPVAHPPFAAPPVPGTPATGAAASPGPGPAMAAPLIRPSPAAPPAVIPHPPSQLPALQKLAQANEQTWLLIGAVSEQMNDLDRALAAYEHAIRHNPHSIAGLTQIAGIARVRENYPTACPTLCVSYAC
ncbi:glucose repression mediator protein [Ceratobasidium sp. 428]|nr:glucose repression mediator protein [Ceratobasidium sp. 428]